MNDYGQQRAAKAKIVALARSILSGGLGIIAGARQLASSRFDARAEHDPDLLFFVGVNSQTDHLPLGDIRSRWSADALKAKDAESQAYEASVRDEAFRICKSLIQRYETDNP